MPPDLGIEQVSVWPTIMIDKVLIILQLGLTVNWIVVSDLRKIQVFRGVNGAKSERINMCAIVTDLWAYRSIA